ncbi:SGNH/GDSL hydrolase family protein, partial [Streptomyces eurythermus]
MTRERRPARRRAAVVAAVLGACALAAAGTAPPAGAHPGGHGRASAYVALGDSYTSGPGIPAQVDAGCARSDHNYPSLVAARRRTSAFTDVSCGGATTAEMWRAQGGNPPQLDALDRHTGLVTVQIGGNDVGFGSIIDTCARLAAQDPAGNPCERAYRASGHDELALAVLRTAPKADRVLRAGGAPPPPARGGGGGDTPQLAHTGYRGVPPVPCAGRAQG